MLRPYGHPGSPHLAVADHARRRAHRIPEPAAQLLEMLAPAVRVQRLLRRPLLDEDELDVMLSLERAEQVIADAPRLAASGFDQIPQDALHLVLLANLGMEDGDHVNGLLRHAIPSRLN